jgi:hypothetical protein
MDRKYPTWRMPFELARVLRGVPAEGPGEFEELVCAFVRVVGVDEVDGWVAFVRCWGLVRCPAGTDQWDLAMEAARGCPLAMNPDPGRRLITLASIAAYLDMPHPGEPFVFSIPRVVASFGWSKATASRAVAALVLLGVIAWADPTWSYTEGRARTARFVATLADPAERAGR